MQELTGIIFLTLTIAPFEETDPQALADLIHDLSVLGLEIAQNEALPVPAEAYDSGRDQYIADVLLTAVQQLSGQHIIGVTDLDLYSGDLNFVFGLAQLPGKAAVISLHRLRSGAHRDDYTRARYSGSANHNRSRDTHHTACSWRNQAASDGAVGVRLTRWLKTAFQEHAQPSRYQRAARRVSEFLPCLAASIRALCAP